LLRAAHVERGHDLDNPQPRVGILFLSHRQGLSKATVFCATRLSSSRSEERKRHAAKHGFLARDLVRHNFVWFFTLRSATACEEREGRGLTGSGVNPRGTVRPPYIDSVKEG